MSSFPHVSHSTGLRARICKPFKEPRIDSQPGGPVRQPYLFYRPARLHRLAESILRSRLLGSLNVYKYGLCPQVRTALPAMFKLPKRIEAETGQGFLLLLIFIILQLFPLPEFNQVTRPHFTLTHKLYFSLTGTAPISQKIPHLSHETLPLLFLLETVDTYI
jgi:hypothetical protein